MSGISDELIVSLSECVPVEYMSEVRDRINFISARYNSEFVGTEVGAYTGYIPNYYKTYMVTQKINGMKDGSLNLYRIRLEDFFYHIGKDLSSIDADDIRLYLFNLKNRRNLCNRTLDGARSIINAFLEWSANERYIDRNPCRNVAPIKFKKHPRTPLNDIEMEQYRNTCVSKRDKALIEFAYSTGCRVSEIASINIADVDMINGELSVIGKGDEKRMVYLNPKAIVCLHEYLNSRVDTNPALFVGAKKPYKRLTKSGIEYIVKKLGYQSHVEKNVFPHLIRHTTATTCVNRGMPLVDVQALLGHANPNTTVQYVKIADSHVKAEHRRCIV